MAKKNLIRPKTKAEKEFLDIFSELCYSRQSWQVWSDFISAASCAIANSVDRDGKVHDAREAEYAKCIERLGGVENGAKLFSCVINALDENPEQDFLGTLFMNLDLASHWKGQFFTPYCICRTMSMITTAGTEAEVQQHGWSAALDPACGAGATLIASANVLKNQGINYQEHVLFVGQDIDRVAGMMCYIQLSLLGCPGYIVIADSLCNPVTGFGTLFPVEKEDQEFWYTPMFCSETWVLRRKFHYMDLFFKSLS